METLKDLLSNPAVIIVLCEVVALLIAKADKSNTLATIIIALGKKLESKKK